MNPVFDMRPKLHLRDELVDDVDDTFLAYVSVRSVCAIRRGSTPGSAPGRLRKVAVRWTAMTFRTADAKAGLSQIAGPQTQCCTRSVPACDFGDS